MSWKHKTLGYWIERSSGFLLGIISALLVFKYWSGEGILSNKDLYDKLITISSTFFAFLLAILTLVIQSNSETVAKMKQYRSYSRLISYNKTAVHLSLLVCFYSFLLNMIFATVTPKEFIIEYGLLIIKFIVGFHVLFTVWMLINTIIFVRLFYLIIQKDIK